MIFNFPIKVFVCNLSSFEMQMWEFFNKQIDRAGCYFT